MPEGDFLSALEVGARLATDVQEIAALPQHLTRICQRRGIPYAVQGAGDDIRFVWQGEPVASEAAIAPALGVLADRRLSDGPATEFGTAQRELRDGSPAALKQAVAEACNAVESTMKVLLAEHDVEPPTPKPQSGCSTH